MKKMFIAFGIAVAILVAGFAMFNRPVDVDALNDQSYHEVLEDVESRYNDLERSDYEIAPKIIRDGVVEKYRVTFANWTGYDYTIYYDVNMH